MNNFIQIIYSNYGRNIFRNDIEWWPYRLMVWKHFTLKSLQNQTNQDFYYMLGLRKCFPEKYLPLARQILNDSGLKYVIAYWDKEGDFEKQIDSKFPQSKYIYATRIDTDDLFHKDVVTEVQKHKFATQRALLYQKGYSYDCVNQRMCHYYKPSPPFSTIMYPRSLFYENKDRRKYENYYRGHDTVINYLNPVFLSENKFIVLVHDKNKRSRPEHVHASMGGMIEKNHNLVLKDFGVDNTTFKKVLGEYKQYVNYEIPSGG